MRVDDLEEPYTLTIHEVGEVEVKDRETVSKRLAIAFHRAQKRLLLNSSNLNWLIFHFGTETDDWIGKKVDLFVDPDVEMGGRKVGGLRLRKAE